MRYFATFAIAMMIVYADAPNHCGSLCLVIRDVGPLESFECTGEATLALCKQGSQVGPNFPEADFWPV